MDLSARSPAHRPDRPDRREGLRGALAAALPTLPLPARAAAPKPLLVGGLVVTCKPDPAGGLRRQG